MNTGKRKRPSAAITRPKRFPAERLVLAADYYGKEVSNMSFCSNCGKELPNDGQKFCPHCGQARSINTSPAAAQPGTVSEAAKPMSYVQTDPKTVRASSLRQQFEAAAPKPAKKSRLGFWVKLIGAALVVYGLTVVCPQVKTPFVRAFKNGEPAVTVAQDTFYDLAGLVGMGDEAALAVVKNTPVPGTQLTLAQALELACTNGSWRVTKRDGKPAAAFSGTLKGGKEALEVIYTVTGEVCAVHSATLNGAPQTVQALDAIVAGAAK